MPAWRLAFDGLTRDRHLEERVLIVGTGPVARRSPTRLRAAARLRLPAGRVHRGSRGRRIGHRRPGARHGRRSASNRRSHGIDRIVVGALGSARPAADRRAAAAPSCPASASRTRRRPTSASPARSSIDDLKPSWLIFSDGFRGLAGDARRQAPARSRAGALVGQVARRAAHAADGARHPARLARAGALPPGARRRERPALHALQVPLDAHRRRAGHADLGDGRRRPRDARRPASSA